MASNGDNARSPSPAGWRQRIVVPMLLAGVVGGGAGLFSKQRKVHGVAKMAAAYATNLAIVTGCYCGARELARDARPSEPNDLINSVIGGATSGALLGRLQGGQLSAVRYAVIFAAAGTAVDFATIQLKPYLEETLQGAVSAVKNMDSSWLNLPEWSPIQVLDEEALAAKRAQQEQLFKARRSLAQLNEEES